MEPIKFTLCPHCTECPEVEITDQEIRIGEDENTVRLPPAAWNELVRLIKDGTMITTTRPGINQPSRRATACVHD